MKSQINELREQYRNDRFAAHKIFFGHRHEDEFASFHPEIVADFWSDEPRLVDLAFRGAAKSTLTEEGVTIAACEGAFRNCLLIGSSEARAAERLAAVSNELRNNELLFGLYGDLVGSVWTQTKLVLKNGRCIQAMGRDQDIRGIKHLDWRPDLIIVDDFEDKDNVQSPEGRRKTLRWFLMELLPACAPKRKIRVYATPMDPESVPMLLIKRAGWPSKTFGICHIDQDGAEISSWPARFPMSWIENERRIYVQLGEADIWEREFMCNAESHADRAFRPEMFRIEHVERAWHAVYAMIDPARTVRRTAAFTGWAVWSWIKSTLIVWESGARHLMPSEIVDLAFRIAQEYRPIEIGIEEDGLNEWLLQPVRSRMSVAGVIPYRGIRAPRGKIDFIKGLQPFFAAGEVILVHEMRELREQLLGFPTGRIDAPNALAYALVIKPGRLVFDTFEPLVHISLVSPDGRRPFYLAANAITTMVSAALMQVSDGRVVVLADWIAEGEPDEAFEGIVRDASMMVGQAITLVAGPRHFDQWQNVGLVQAARSFGMEVRNGGAIDAGKVQIRREMARLTEAGPGFVVHPEARWTLNALAGGYSRPLRDGELSSEPADNRYRLLMEGIESLCGLFAWGIDETQAPGNYRLSKDGHRYLSAMPERA